MNESKLKKHLEWHAQATEVMLTQNVNYEIVKVGRKELAAIINAWGEALTALTPNVISDVDKACEKSFEARTC